MGGRQPLEPPRFLRHCPFTNRYRRTQGGYGGRSKRKLLKQQLNQALQDDSLLAHYDEAKPLLLACDASQCGLGAVLSHIMEYGKEKPVAFAIP